MPTSAFSRSITDQSLDRCSAKFGTWVTLLFIAMLSPSPSFADELLHLCNLVFAATTQSPKAWEIQRLLKNAGSEIYSHTIEVNGTRRLTSQAQATFFSIVRSQKSTVANLLKKNAEEAQEKQQLETDLNRVNGELTRYFALINESRSTTTLEPGDSDSLAEAKTKWEQFRNENDSISKRLQKLHRNPTPLELALLESEIGQDTTPLAFVKVFLDRVAEEIAARRRAAGTEKEAASFSRYFGHYEFHWFLDLIGRDGIAILLAEAMLLQPDTFERVRGQLATKESDELHAKLVRLESLLQERDDGLTSLRNQTDAAKKKLEESIKELTLQLDKKIGPFGVVVIYVLFEAVRHFAF
jgi:hypothetical protein